MVSLGVSLSIGIGVVSRLGRAISTKYIVARTRFVLAPGHGAIGYICTWVSFGVRLTFSLSPGLGLVLGYRL